MNKNAKETVRGIALLVEDDPDLQGAMTREFEGQRFAVVPAYDYGQALERLCEVSPTLVCVDLGLPNESGYELCEQIRRTTGLTEVPILVTSESNFPEAMAQAEEVGANAFLRKPFTMSDLRRYVEALVERRPASRPHFRRLKV
jgi:two-component system chemotaxis response regulator CheY